jgi:hypothetical protein
MTKIKNTKKGMAKKTLSMSLVVAMLATSNVPVWAAEFSDGTDDVAVATEAPAAETFSDETAEAPVATEEDVTNATAENINDNLYTGTITFTNVSDNAVEWDSSISANVAVKDAQSGNDVNNFYYAWKVNGVAPSYGAFSKWDGNTAITKQLDATYAGKTISLMLAVKDNADNVSWTYESAAITVKKKLIGNSVKINDTKIPNPTYTGQELKADVPTDILSLKEGITDAALTNIDNYKVAYTAKDFVNVTDEGITVTLTPDEDKLPGYTGEIKYTYKIKSKDLNSYTDMKATLANTSYAYTGKPITKIKASDITLVDRETGADLSNYLNVDKDGFVGISEKTLSVDGSSKLWVDLIKGTPKKGNKNYNIVGSTDTQEARRIQTENEVSVVARDLSTVVATIPQQKYNDGKKVQISVDDVVFKDKTTGEELKLTDQDIEISVPDNAKESGETYTATISAKEDSKNVKGSTTADFTVYSSDIGTAKFFDGTKEITLPQKYYTGEQVTFTAKELGTLKIKNTAGEWVAVDPKDYEIVYGTNINADVNGNPAGTLTIVGKNSYKGSSKSMTFSIAPAALSSVETEKYVEILDTQNPKDYKDVLNLVVKAKSGTGNSAKEFTLTSNDYTVKYEYVTGTKQSDGSYKPSSTKGSNTLHNFVKVTVTITNDNFKGTASSVKNYSETELTAMALKDEYIKLRENNFTYTGKEIKPDFDVVIGGKVINPDYYHVSYTNNIYAGTATLTIKGDGTKYSDKKTAKVTFTINPAKTEDLVGVLPSRQYRGYSLEVPADEIYATLNGSEIDVAKNFTLTYGENLHIGEGTVTLTPKNGNFTGTKTFTFKIVGELIKNGDLKFYDANGVAIENQDDVFTYDGTEKTFAKTVFDTATTVYVDNNGKTFSKKLVEGTDYEIKYVDNVAGKNHYGAVLVIAKGQYGGAYDDSNRNGLNIVNGVYTDADGNKISNVIYAEKFEITPQYVADTNITVSNGTYTGGLPVKPEVKVVVKGVTLVEGKDYDLKYDANADRTKVTAGKKLWVCVVPKNGYWTDDEEGIWYQWGIDKFNLANADVTVDGDKVTVKCGRVDVETSEYTVEQKDGKVTVTAKKDSKNYTGSKTIDAATQDQKPAAPMISNVKVVGNKATVILSGESEGAAGYDYVISTDRDCITNKDYTSVNKNQVKTNTTFEYVGQNTYYAYCHAWKRDENGKKVFSDWSNAYPFVVSAITPSQPVITSVKVKGSTVTVTYTKASNADGYDVVLGTSTKKVNGETRPVEYGKLVKKNIKGNVVTATFKNVKKGTYYAGLHAFNRTSEDGKKVFSQWSNVKKVTVK